MQDFQLTPIQQMALPTIKWLIKGGKATGRSTVIAYALMEEALEHLGEWIDVWDHSNNYQNKKYLILAIKDLLAKQNYGINYTCEMRIDSMSFRILYTGGKGEAYKEV